MNQLSQANSNRPFLKPPVFGIVIYRMLYHESKSFRTLTESIRQYAGSSNPVDIIIYDNSENPLSPIGSELTDNLPFIRVHYRSNPSNPGIGYAYNRMSEMATSMGAEWMVILDQDTEFPLIAFAGYMEAISRRPDAKLKAPVLKVGSTIFSPSRLVCFKSIPLSSIRYGVRSLRGLTCANSGLAVELSVFNKIGGYSEMLKLDFADLEFVERLKRFIDSMEVLPFSCNHDFSNEEVDKVAVNKRFLIYKKDLYNFPARSRWEKLNLLLVGYLHALKLSWRFKDVQFVIQFMKSTM